MKNLLAIALLLSSASAWSAQSKLLQDALSCQLENSQIPTLMRDLAAQQPAFAAPATQYGAPSADMYQLREPVTALGYTSGDIVVMPGRILLAVPGEPIGKAIDKLKLTEEPYSPAGRQVRPTVRVVALQLTHKNLDNRVLVGCEYANGGAARWIRP